MEYKYDKLFEPIQIGKCTVKNRYVMAPMGPMGLTDAEGSFTSRGVDYYAERAKGGTGLIITGVCFVDELIEKHFLPSSPSTAHNPVQFIRTSRELTERVHAYGSKIFLQMSGGFGRVIPPAVLADNEPVAPSPIQHKMLDIICRELTVEEIHSLVKQFGKGAQVAQKAGYDGVQIHAVHEGYLIDQFAISFFNHRTDEYGGSLENRLRLAREIIEEIKSTCGEDFPVILRYSPKSFIKDWREGALPGEEFEEKGRDVKEGKEAAKLLAEYGYEALDIDVGCYDAWWWNHPPMYQKKGLYRPYAKMIKEVVDVPIICAGRMDDPDMALEAIEDNVTDMISLGRPLLADPEYVNKLCCGQIEDIRPCLSCQEGCMGRLQRYSLLNCAVNPQACRERDYAYKPITSPKKVLIVGGGVAGCEAARVLAVRGHSPILFEKSHKLGGNLIAGGAPDFKEDDLALVRWYEHMLNVLNVPIELNMEMTGQDILEYEADAVIIATGSKPKMISFEQNTNVFTAAEVLLDKQKAGKKTAIIGGGLVGCEAAIWLADNGVDVTIVENLDTLMAVNGPLCTANKNMLEKLVYFKGVNVITGTKAKSFSNGVLELENEVSVECDSLILAVGYVSEKSLYDELKHNVRNMYLLGDAKNVANVMYAIWDAFEIANNIL